MSIANDVEAVASVPPVSGVQQALFLDSVTNLWRSKKSDGSSYPISSFIDSFFVDVTTRGLKADDSTDNLAAWNTMYAAAQLFETHYYPPGTFRFSGERTMNRDIRLRVMGAGSGRSLIRDTSATANGFNQTVAGFYVDFFDVGFALPTVTKTAGSALRLAGNNAGCRIRGLEFNGQFNGIELNGSGGNLSSITDCNFQSPAPNGSQILVNGPNLNIVLSDLTTNCVGVAGTSGVQVNASGAIQITACDFIGGQNTFLINATGVVSAIIATNVFLDQAGTGSTFKIQGTGACSRVKWIGGGITNGAAGLAAIEIAGTGTGTSIPDGIDFFDVDIYNNGFGGTTNGALITGARGVQFMACRVAGQTNGIQVTPYNSNGVTTINIVDCTIGPTENFAANTNGIVLNAGAVQYGAVFVQNNNLLGNTTANLVDNSTVITTGAKVISGNVGWAAGNGVIATLSGAVTTSAVAATETVLMSARVLANSVAVGQTFRWTIWGISAGLGTKTFRSRVGANGTIADNQTWLTAASAASVANAHVWASGMITVRGVGAGSAIGDGMALHMLAAPAIIPTGNGAAATGAITTTAPWFIDITCADSVASGFVAQGGMIEAL